MLRKLVLAGVVVGTAASVPIFLENNPEMMATLWNTEDRSEQQQAATSTIGMARLREPERGQVLPGRRVRLAADSRGHFVADFKFNGRTVSAMVDTGASVVAINETTARRIGIRLRQADFTGVAETANGRAKAAIVTIDRIEIGRVEFRNVAAAVLEDRALSSTLVGMSFLSQLTRYQVEGGALVLEQ